MWKKYDDLRVRLYDIAKSYILCSINLFISHLICLEYATSDDWMISEQYIEKIVKWLWPNINYCQSISLEEDKISDRTTYRRAHILTQYDARMTLT